MAEKRKKSAKKIIALITGICGIITGFLGGKFYVQRDQNKYIQSQVANVIGEGNNVSVNNVDDLVKNYNELAEENKALEEKNTKYFEDYNLVSSEKKLLEEQLQGSPVVQLKNLKLCINGADININNNNSCAIINGAEYFSKEFINNLVDKNTSVIIQDDTLFIGRVIAEKADLFSQRIVDSDNYDIIENAVDSYGNTHAISAKFENGTKVIYSLNEQYSLLRLKIAIDESSSGDKECAISILADGKPIYSFSNLNKVSTKELDYTDLNINKCSILEIACTGDWYTYPLIYSAEVYN